jgi:hypothetical protein
MAVRVIRENNRSEGLKPHTGVTAIIAGQPLVKASATTVKPHDTLADVVFGIAAESTGQLPIAPLSGLTAGEGFDYTNFARGGLVSCFVNGSELELYDDGHGVPFTDTDTYTLNREVYADESTGLITSDATGGRKAIGSVTDVEGSPVTRLRVKFNV